MRRSAMNKKFIKTLLIAFVLIIFMIINPYKIIVVRGESMYPTYKNGDILLGSKDRNYLKGDIVVLKNDFDETIIKRITYMPGETYYTVSKIVSHDCISETVDKKTYEDTKQNSKSKYIIAMKDKVPLNQYFITGDNKNNSDDSRRFGSIEKAKILYKIIK
jgi:signal peptidase I